MPENEIEKLPADVRALFVKWADFMDCRVVFNMPGSEIHASAHCERVLLYTLLMGSESTGVDADGLESLAHAAVFHDTRRLDDYLDTGHGARASVYYEQFCKSNPDITFHPESVLLMRYHDLDDSRGRKAIDERFGAEAERVQLLYSIFKDADALDRWRLGRYGLDVRYLRTDQARRLVDYARRIVGLTTPQWQLSEVEQEYNRLMGERHGG